MAKGSSGLGGEIYFNISDIDFFGALEFVNKNDTLGTYERMKKSGYLRKRLIV